MGNSGNPKNKSKLAKVGQAPYAFLRRVPSTLFQRSHPNRTLRRQLLHSRRKSWVMLGCQIPDPHLPHPLKPAHAFVKPSCYADAYKQ